MGGSRLDGQFGMVGRREPRELKQNGKSRPVGLAHGGMGRLWYEPATRLSQLRIG